MAIGDKIYNLEINDSEFEREGWQRGRYKGTKLKGAQINKFTKGDVTYGTEPVIEQYSKTVYVFSRANNSFESRIGSFWPSLDEFGHPLSERTIIGSTAFTIDRAVTFTIDDPSTFDQTDVPDTNIIGHITETLIKTDLALFNSCSVKFFDNANNGFVKPFYTVGYNRGSFKPAAIYFQSQSADANGVLSKAATNVSASGTIFDYEISNGGRLYVNPNVEEWFIAQDGASGSLGTLLGGNVALTIDHLGDKNQVNSVEGYFHQLSKRLGPKSSKKERYYISFNSGKDSIGTTSQKNLLKAFDIHELAHSGSNINLTDNTFSIKNISSRFDSPFITTYNGANKEEYVIFKENQSINTIHLNFNLDTEAPVGAGNGGVIIPNNIHPDIKEQLNVFLSNAGLGAEGGTRAAFGLGQSIQAQSAKQIGSNQLNFVDKQIKETSIETRETVNDSGGSSTKSNVSKITGGGSTEFSDIRLKENIIFLRKSPSGIPIYKFNYKGKTKTYTGTMAQDLLKLGFNNAVIKNPNGYYSVNYNLIDVNMKQI